MRYTILSIDDSRKQYTNRIRQQLSDWQEVKIECVNGNDRVQLDEAIEEFGVHVGPGIKVGQAGCYLSTLKAITQDDDPIMVFNDDVVLCDNFIEEFNKRLMTVPEDCDVFTAFIPRDHDQNFYYGVMLDDRSGKTRLEPMFDYWPEGHEMFESNGVTCRSYMRYGGPALYFTSKGKRKYLALEHIVHQVDEVAYLAGYFGQLNVYTSVPSLFDLASIIPNEPSLCQETEYYNGDFHDNN